MLHLARFPVGLREETFEHLQNVEISSTYLIKAIQSHYKSVVLCRFRAALQLEAVMEYFLTATGEAVKSPTFQQLKCKFIAAKTQL